jgi:predicted amidohydrolase
VNKPIKVALIQYTVQEKWQDNVNQVERLLTEAHRGKAELSILPEMFVQPYDMTIVPDRAESVPEGPTSEKLSGWAQRFKMVIVGGSVAELGSDGKYYNTATLWSPDGELLAKHRKVHLFDVDLPGGVSFRESDILSPGHQVTVVRVLGMNLGIAVCYDIRFPELSRIMTLKGAVLIALPGAFPARPTGKSCKEPGQQKIRSGWPVFLAWLRRIVATTHGGIPCWPILLGRLSPIWVGLKESHSVFWILPVSKTFGLAFLLWNSGGMIFTRSP